MPSTRIKYGFLEFLNIGFLFAAAILLLVAVGCKKEQKAGPPPVPEVVVIKVTPKNVPAISEYVAQAESSHQVDIVARVAGFLEKIMYKEGDLVKEGQVLFMMDQKPFRAQVAAAKGEVENRKAQLWTAQANLNRIKPLAEQNAASKSDLDNAIGATKSAEAELYQAKARLEKAELDLSYTIIKTPVSGVSSQSLMREGSYLTPIGTGAMLTYVVQVDPIWINFSISQNDLTKNRQEVASGEIITPKERAYIVELEQSDGSRYPYQGKVSFAEPSFNQQTGTFLVRAEFPNPKAVLQPGMFIKAYLKGAVRPNAIVVPQKAVQETSNGHMVYVVNQKGQAEPRPVIVGEWDGEDWIIRQGLTAGDQVIVEGFQKLVPGVQVKVVEPGAAASGTSAEPKKVDTSSGPVKEKVSQ
jgi:membrane fusion protein, multidrug efflux system